MVCGGTSSRMGTDKSMLQYYNKPQCHYLYEMLASICDEALISYNSKQAAFINDAYPTLLDVSAFEGIGPMAALLSAFYRKPNADILFIGCDYPFLEANELRRFIDGLHRNRPEAFYNSTYSIYEPLLAYYPGSACETINEMYAAADFSLQHFLHDQHAGKFIPSSMQTIQSVDTKEAFQEAISIIKNKRSNTFTK